MAGAAPPKPEPTGQQAFFDAVDELTYRDMLAVAGLIALQLGENGCTVEPAVVAKCLSDAADSFADSAD